MALDQNSRAGSEELLSLHKRVKKKFKELGYVNTAKNDCADYKIYPHDL